MDTLTKTIVIVLSLILLPVQKSDASLPLPDPAHAKAYYGFENSALDLSGNINNGNVHNVIYAPGYDGEGISLDGTGYVTIPRSESLVFNDKLTIEMWIYQTGRRFVNMRLFEIGDGKISLWTCIEGKLHFDLTPPMGEKISMPSATELGPLYMNRWIHIAAVLGNGIMALYMNGNEVNRFVLPPSLTSLAYAAGDIVIGNSPDGKNGFMGVIDEVRISNDFSPTAPALQTDLTSFPSKGTLKIAANISGFKTPLENPRAIASLMNQGQPREIKLNNFVHGTASGIMDVKDLPEGTYQVTVSVQTGSGTVICSQTSSFTKMDNPEWKGTYERLTAGKVLYPWTPLQIDSKTISCWGRTYSFSDNSLFPVEIITDKNSILSAPIQLTAKIGSQIIRWNETNFELIKAADDKIELVIKGKESGILAVADITIEFDGMIKIDLSLQPDQAVQIDELTFEIPLKQEYAKYYHYTPSESWSYLAKNAGEIPKEGLEFFFKPYLWLGDEDRGICWFTDSYDGWNIDKNKKAVNVQTKNNGATVAVSFFNKPTTLSKKWQTTFGIEATPVKPRMQGYRTWRFGNSEGHNIQIFWANPRYVKWYFLPDPIDTGNYNALIDSYHKKGIKFTNYSCFQFVSPSTEAWKYNRGDWYDSGYGVAGHSDVIEFNEPVMKVCQRSTAWRDYFPSLYEKYFQKTNADGIYIDWSTPTNCGNPEHEYCYFYDDEGNKQLKWNIFEIREVMKAINAAVKKAGTEKIIVCHMSTQLVAPFLAFCDAYVDGEQFWAGETFDGNYIKAITPGQFIAELMGKQIGLVDFFLPELIGDQIKNPKYTETLLTLLALHDANLWFRSCNVEAVQKMWKAMDKFGLDGTEFIPYWKSQPYVSGASDKVKISIYYHQGKDAMLVVGNLGDKNETANFKLSLKSLGIKGNEIINLSSNEPVKRVAENLISEVIPSENYQLIMVR